MFEFQQYLAFIVGVIILLMGFWLLIFLIGTAIYWAIGGAIDLAKENRAKKRAQEQQV